ncbi:MAG: AAA family ATPase, partial [Rhodothermales bacterium]|nr:AAA family ATPase [Rhodothermales bacterium]
MIVYSASRADFTSDVLSNQIEKKILDAFSLRLGRRTSRAEIESWKNSMQYMNNVLIAGDIPEDAGVAIEYQVPLTSKRVDFILSGADAENRDTAVIVELKQWSDVEATSKDAIVQTFVGGAVREVAHPSYQAWTYAALIRDFNVEVQDGNISLHPCAYLHNCSDPSAIKSAFYSEHAARAPVFVRDDADRLSEFLKQHVRYGDKSRILYKIDHGRLRPSKNLADHLASLLQGNREFEMIDDQKVVYET